MGGITRPKDLRVIARSTGANLERLKADQPFFPDPSTPERVSSSSRVVLNDLVEPAQNRPPQNNTTHVDVSLVAHHASQLSFNSPKHARDFHTSSRVPYDSTSYNVTQVPDFFVRYKEQRAASPTTFGVNTEESGLMQSLTDSILSGDIVASTRRLKTKTPVEHHVPGGQVVHASGYVVPGPGHISSSDVARAKEGERNESIDRGRQKAAITDCVLKFDLRHVDATTLHSLHKVPIEVREPDGTIKHPSGFTPPTPSHKFRYHKDTSGLRARKVSSMKQKARQVSPGHGILRAMHTSQASGGS